MDIKLCNASKKCEAPKCKTMQDVKHKHMSTWVCFVNFNPQVFSLIF